MKISKTVLFLSVVALIFSGLVLAGNAYGLEDECFLDGEVSCYNSYKTWVCGDYDNNGLLEWSTPQLCPGDNSCGYGTCLSFQRPGWYCFSGQCNPDSYFCYANAGCETSCDNECNEDGLKECYGTGATEVKTCGNYDDDPCLEWNHTGNCYISYIDECGFGLCDEDERAESPYCYDGKCYYDCSWSSSCCSNECSTNGTSYCIDGETKKTCGYYDADDCLDWSDPQSCADNTSCGYEDCNSDQRSSWSCSGGECVYSCFDDDTCCINDCSDGQTRCFDYSRYQDCDYYDDDPCLDWSEPQSCVSDTFCGYGDCTDDQKPSWYCAEGWCLYDCFEDSECGSSCLDECSPEGLFQCVSDSKKTCGNYDSSDSCLEWSSLESCIGSTVCGYGSCYDNERPDWYCSGGNCLYSCNEDSSCDSGHVDECDFNGQAECYNNDYKRICGYYDNISALRWSSPQLCVGNTSCGYETCSDSQRPDWYCSGGDCAYTCFEDSSCVVNNCVDECSARYQTRCADDSRREVCGYHYDTDSCLEWYAPEVCAGDTSCGYGDCNDNQRSDWYCDTNTNDCGYQCVQDSNCLSDYVDHFEKRCYDDDVYWYDSENQLREKEEECEDDNSDTIDGCENDRCFHRSEEEDYCQGQDHCGDGICNCDEDVYICFEDCEFASVKVSVFVKKESDKDWSENIKISPKEKMDILLTVFNESQEDFANTIVKVQLPQEIIYKEKLKIDNISFEGDIRDGVNIGFLSSNAEKEITFEGEVSSEAMFGTETEIRGSVEVEDISDSNSAGITIEKAQKTFGSVLKWLVSRWYIWFLLWILFVAFLYWIIKRGSS